MVKVSIHLVVSAAVEAADWYVAALDARETGRLTLPDGRTLTVDLLVGDTAFAVAGELPELGMRTPKNLGGTSAALHLAVSDVDAADRAIAVGATVFEPVRDAFWGERTGQFVDPFGHRWALDQHLRDVPAVEIAREAARLFNPAESS